MCCHHSSFLLTIDHRIRLIVASQLSSFSSPFLRSHRHHLPPSPHESRLSSLVWVTDHSIEWARHLIATRALRCIHWRRKGSASGLAIVFDSFDRSSTAAGSSRWWWVLLTPIKPSACTLRVAPLPTDFSLSFYSAPNSDWNVLVSLPLERSRREYLLIFLSPTTPPPFALANG